MTQVTWGTRAENADECARRWLSTIRALAAIDQTLTGWVIQSVDVAGRPRMTALTEDDVLPVVEAGAHVDGGVAQRDLGFSFGTVNGRDGGQEVFFHATAGLSAPVPGLLNTVRLEVRPEAPAEVRRWSGIAEAALTVLVSAWEPDHGQVWSFPVRQAQRPAPRQPWAGPVTYLSAGRARLVPDDIAAAGRPTPDGGLLLSVIPPGGRPPSDEAVTALGVRLREAGAFEPVPVERARW